MKQTQHCVVSVFSWADKNEYRFRQFLAIAILTENLYNFAKKDEKTQKRKENI